MRGPSIERVTKGATQVLERVTKGANSAEAPATATARQGDSDMWKKVCPMPIDKFTHHHRTDLTIKAKCRSNVPLML